MKRLFTTLILSITLISSFAQSNIIKWNVMALGLGNVSLQYERSINTHSSVALGFSILPTRGLPSTFTDKSTNTDLLLLSFSGWSITPEYRYYCSNNGPKGFYFAPYLRYSKYSIDNIDLSYDDDNLQFIHTS